MKNFHKIGLSAVLAAGLLGCQAQLPLVSQLQDKASVDGQTAAAPLVSAGDLPKVNLVSQQGQVTITIKWPERQIQAIPTSANTIRVRFTPAMGDPINDVIARDPQNPTITRSYNLKKAMVYTVEVKAFRELAAAVTANGDSLTAIATGTNSINVTADETKSLSVSLVPLYQPTLTPANYASGDGAQFQIAGDGFGTDPSEIKVYVTNSADPLNDQGAALLPIATMSNTVITVTAPTYDGKLVVKRDGVPATNSGTSQVTFARATSISARPEQALLKYSNTTYKYYAMKGTAFTLPVTAWANNSQTSNFIYSVSVKDASNNDVTSDVYSNGQFTLPSEGKYTIKFSSGTQNGSTDVYAATVNWAQYAPTCDVPTAPYYLTSTINEYSGTAGRLLLATDYSLTCGSDVIKLNNSDFTFSNTGTIVTPSNSSSDGYLQFTAGSTAGTANVLAALKYAPSYSFTTSVPSVRLENLGVKYDSNYVPNVYNQENWVDIPSNTFSLLVGQKRRVRLDNFTYTGGDPITNPDWSFIQNLTWASRAADNTDTSAIASVAVDGNNNYAIITAKAAGTAYIRLKYGLESNPSKYRIITVNVQ